MSTTILINRILISVAVVTTLGILLHDTKFDKATTLALSLPAMALSLGATAYVPNLQGESHTHVERAAFDKSSRIANSVPPRDDYRKYLISKHSRSFNAPEPHSLVLDPVLA